MSDEIVARKEEMFTGQHGLGSPTVLNLHPIFLTALEPSTYFLPKSITNSFCRYCEAFTKDMQNHTYYRIWIEGMKSRKTHVCAK